MAGTMIKSSSATIHSSLSSFSEDYDTALPDPPPVPINDRTIHSPSHGKKPVHKIEPLFDHDKKTMRVFLEDGSLSEYSIDESTTAAELVEQMAIRHSLGSDMRRFRLTLNEAQDVLWRTIRYVRPHQKLREIAEWSSTTLFTICTLRVVIVPSQAERLADTEPITFTYLYRQSINDYVRERAGSEISADIAVQLTALLILDESLCTGARPTNLVKRTWLLRQLFPRTLFEQFSLKQLINRIRIHLQTTNDQTQLSVAKEFIRLFSENTRSFAGKLFPVKFPDKHRDTILLLGPRYPVAIIDQARRVHSPVIPLISAWSHLTRVIIKEYRNGIAIRLITTPRTTPAENDALQQEISFLIHTNLLNDFMTFIEGYSQLESADCPLAIEKILAKHSSNETKAEQRGNSPLAHRIMNNKRNHRTYRIVQEKSTIPTSPSLFALTRQFFTRQSTKIADIDEQETISNVPNRTSLVTWRSLADTQPLTSELPTPVLYRTVINVEVTDDEKMASTGNDDEESSNEPDIIDLTTSVGYYGSLSFPLRPPSPFSDGVIWSEMSQQPRQEEDSLNEVFIWSPDTKQLTVHYNVNNNNSTHIEPIPPVVSRATNNWKRVWNRLVHGPSLTTTSRIEDTNNSTLTPYNFGSGDNNLRNHRNSKRVHWVDDDRTVVENCSKFVAHLKDFVQNVINNRSYESDWKQGRNSLNALERLIDCRELRQAYDECLVLARQNNRLGLLGQQTLIAQLISRTISSSSSVL